MISGLPLLEWRAKSPARADLERCVQGLGGAILEFLRAHVGRTFHADELRAFVTERHPSAPGSADRVLRDLRQRGYCRVVCESRSDSLYRCLSVGRAP